VRRADNLATFMCRSVIKYGSHNLLEPSGHVQTCTWVSLPVPFTHLWLRFPPIILSAIHAYRYLLNRGWHCEFTMSLKDWGISGWNTRWHYIFIPTFLRLFSLFFRRILKFEGCLTVPLPHEIKWNANLMQVGNFIDVFLTRHVSGTYAHHQEH